MREALKIVAEFEMFEVSVLLQRNGSPLFVAVTIPK